MNSIPRISLEDTYHLIQLARDAALAQGRKAQADKLKPVIDEMRSLVDIEKSSAFRSTAQAREQQAFPLSAPADHALGRTDFDRNRLVQAMAAADVPALDIARQLGMSRDEVNLVIETGRKNSAPLSHRRG